MYKKLSYIAVDAILAIRDDDTQILIEPQSGEIWKLASTGALGEVHAYVAPPEPTYAEKLSEWRSVAYCEMMELQDAIIDMGIFEEAEVLSAQADPKWRIRWEARAGVSVRRLTGALTQYAETLIDAAAIDASVDDWLDDLVKWTPPKPKEK